MKDDPKKLCAASNITWCEQSMLRPVLQQIDSVCLLAERRCLVGMELVVKHGAEHTSSMLSVFEGYLEAKGVKDESSYDRVREGVVIFLGTLAQHLDAAGPKVTSSHPKLIPSLLSLIARG